MRAYRPRLAAVLVVMLLTPVLALAAMPAPARADVPGNDHFWRTWARHDRPVTLNQDRTWMWGPAAFTGPLPEFYEQAEPYGSRTVQYFDKARMEITHPDADPSSIWYVTNGLLVNELVSGRIQVGDAQYDESSPAQIGVAGDPDDDRGPTYAAFGDLLDVEFGMQLPVISVIDHDGNVETDDAYARYEVEAKQFVAETGHWIAEPFWQFMNSSGAIYVDGEVSTGPLFENPYYATGYPIVEPYWAEVKVGGSYRDVLMQCFERRCLTYTPDNPPAWQVEAGNVGQHYYRWRYGALPMQPSGTITFASSRDGADEFVQGGVYTARADGSYEFKVSSNLAQYRAPQLSPDGTQVAWSAYVDGDYEVLVANVDGTDLRNLTNRPGYDADPAWSPDGSQIAYVSARDDEGPSVYVMNVDGSGDRQLSTAGRERQPVWSPDGTMIAYPSTRVDPVGRYTGVYVIDADGSDERQLSPCAADPVWTPDGSEVVVIASDYCAGGYLPIYVVNNQGTETRELGLEITDGLSFNRDIAYSPDGTKVTFTIYIGDNSEVYIADSDFENIERLTNNPAYDSQPTWSPDNQWIAFTSTRDGNLELYAIDLAWRAEHRVTFSAANESLPMWR